MNHFQDELNRRLAAIREQGLYRELRRIDSPQIPQLQLDGKELLGFSSNDYLGLANEPALKEAAIQAVERYGAGAGASRLICGSLAPHRELDEAIAAFKGSEAALSFSTGFAAAQGAIGALCGKDDVIILDKLVHACIVDAARLSGAKLRVFAHNDLDDLERILQWAAKRPSATGQATRPAPPLIVTESVFSMDGDHAPLREIADLKDQHGAWLMVDEAHATGLYGPNRRGLAEELKVSERIEVHMGTLGKALGASGGYIAGSRALIDYLINRARTFIFSTAPVPAAAAAATAGIRFVQSALGEQRRQLLWQRVSELRSTLNAQPSTPQSAIFPLLIGDETAAVQAAAALREQSIFIPAIRYPTVARGQARLRLTLTAAHTAAHITQLAAALSALRPSIRPSGFGLQPSPLMTSLARLDHQYLWHPFTQMRDWLKHEPIVIVEGRGAVLRDVHDREYLDANSSIWTNLHGHSHPKLNAAIQRQLKKVAHTSALGLANEPASLLAKELVSAANPRSLSTSHRSTPRLAKVFFSDDGSTAMEVALKLAFQYSRLSGRRQKPRFLSLKGAYHGDTVGAVSLGHIDLFHQAYSRMLFKTDEVMAPYCYRCPFNRAKPERADAREYRKCHWECLGKLEQKFTAQKRKGNPYAAFVFEPLMQGAAGLIPQPPGWLRQAAAIARAHGALLIADEVMTGFGRTGSLPEPPTSRSSVQGSKFKVQSSTLVPPSPFAASLFSSHKEGVQPDFLAVAKGLTGGYLPMAATLTTQAVFDAFLGEYDEFKTFFHGHSFTANQLGAAAGLASLKLLESPDSLRARCRLEQTLRTELETLWALPHVGDIRQVGLVAGIELVKDWRTREPLALRERAGIRVCEAMAKRGVLTRPVGNVIVLMPPYCTTPAQASSMVQALHGAIQAVRL